MAATLEKGSQERNDKKYSQGSSNKASYMKRDAELKKIFGLTKDLRVCLTRIPEHLGSGKVSDFFRSSVKNSTYKEAEIMVKAEEKKQQGFDKKRKAKTIKKMKYTERKTKSAVSTVINGATNVTSSQLLSSTLPLSDISQHDISHSKTREEKRTELERYSCEKQEKGACSSSAAFEESSSVNKNYTEDIFLATPPELEETIRDEKIRRLKHVLREKEAALEEMRKKMHQNKKKVF